MIEASSNIYAIVHVQLEYNDNKECLKRLVE